MENHSHFRSVSELRAGVLIWQIASPFLIIFGTTGNVLAIIIFVKPKFNRFAHTRYFLGLAVADVGFLYVGLLRQWIYYSFDIDIRWFHPLVCKVHMWLMYTFADTTVWILTAITAERLVAVYVPHKVKILCTKARAAVILAAITVCAMLINSHILYGFGKLEIFTTNTSLIIPCAPLTAGYEYFLDKIWTWIDMCKYSIIPFAVLSTGNVCIVYKLVSSHKKTRSQIVPATAQATSSVKDAQTAKLSRLLVGLNCMFLISTLPVCIYFICAPYWIPEDVPRKIQLQDPWWALVNILMYINNSANFMLYCLTGSKFRNAVMDMFKCRRVRNLNEANTEE